MRFKNKVLDLSRPRVMGILNVTPDSFSDGGQFSTVESAIKQAAEMLDDGADFIDVGGESTRPGASPVSADQELERVIPVIQAIHARFDTIISIDSSKPVVMTQAVEAGAGLINDVRALREDGAVKAATDSGAAVCLMHMLGQPRTMQSSPCYDDVVKDVELFLQTRIDTCLASGIPKEQLIIDPGFGFGKTLAHNYQLLGRLDEFNKLNIPLLIGVSRKSMIGDLLNRDVEDRLSGSLAAATVSLMKGARILRVHDVKQNVDAVKVVSALSAFKD